MSDAPERIYLQWYGDSDPEWDNEPPECADVTWAAEQVFDADIPYRRERGFDLEVLAEAVHEAYLRTCKRLGWSVNAANAVPYSDLSEDSKELDRQTALAVLAKIGIRIEEEA